MQLSAGRDGVIPLRLHIDATRSCSLPFLKGIKVELGLTMPTEIFKLQRVAAGLSHESEALSCSAVCK